MPRNSHRISVIASLLIASLGLSAQGRRHESKPQRPASVSSTNCFEPNDPGDIRLWDGPAPGARGDDPCRDVPYLKVFRTQSGSQKPRAAIIVIGGGGYGIRVDAKFGSSAARGWELIARLEKS